MTTTDPNDDRPVLMRALDIAFPIVEADITTPDITTAESMSLLSLGPSNDEPEAVRVEMRAMETLDAWITDQRQTKRRGFCLIDDRLGWDAHSSNDDPDSMGWVGWLVREMCTHDDRDQRDAWPWDPARPIAGQYEEWLAAQSCPVDHDYTKSVVALADGIVEAAPNDSMVANRRIDELQHAPSCDKNTDDAFPCNAGCGTELGNG